LCYDSDNMSKVAQYLNEHLLGEVTTNDNVRRRFAHDGSVLAMLPDMVIYPRSTSDLRKVARFSWQLAEKGHKLPITVRGGGTDQTGAAIGTGVIISTPAHLDTVFEVDAKQKLVRLQPGVTFKSLNQLLGLQNLYIPSYPASQAYSTIGGAIANNASGVLSGKYGATSEWVQQLEVVLSNGDILQTGRISKRELGRKKGLQTFEGEIYRTIDNLVNDNVELIDSLAVDARDNAGYNIVDVKRRDGSVDLTPLFVGSQGTLGIVSEVILKTEQVPVAPLVGAIAFADYDSARDGLDILRTLNPSVLELIDARLFVAATERGKRYPFYADALDQGDVAAVVLVEFDDAGDRSKKKIAKKVSKLFADMSAYVVLEHDAAKAEDLHLLGLLPAIVQLTDKPELSTPPLLTGAYIPPERFEDFAKAVEGLESKHHVELPLSGHASQHVYYSHPLLNFQKVGDRQKVFKLLSEWSTIIPAHGGHLIGEAGEGRLKAPFAYKELDKDVKDLYASIKELFDPLEIMNTGVKQATELKKLATDLRSDYDGSDFAFYGIND
jgi:FAD/FMN-containing dehydrogenase